MLRKALATLAVVIGVGVLFSGGSAEAASFDQMRNLVETEQGVLLHPKLGWKLTQEEALSFYQTIDTELHNRGTSTVTKEMEMKAYDAIALSWKAAGIDRESFLNTNPALDVPIDKSTRGVSIPTREKVLTGGTYTSDTFSGAGTRYSGYYFTFDNYAVNPYFAIRVNHDSMTGVTRLGTAQVATLDIYPDGQFQGMSSSLNGNLNCYIMTVNPIGGSFYEIQ